MTKLSLQVLFQKKDLNSFILRVFDYRMVILYGEIGATLCIQLFRERLSEKVHATIPKGIVGGFEFTVLQRNLKELVRKAMEMGL